MKKQFFAAICSLTMLAGAAGYVPALNLTADSEAITAEALSWLGSEVKDNIRWYYYYSNDINSMADYKIVKAVPVNSTVTHAKFPSTVCGKPIRAIGNDVFEGDTQIKTAWMPSQITNIGNDFFKDSRLESITLSAGLRGIDHNAFRHATKLQNIVVPNTCYWVGDYFCYDCDSLRNANFGNSVQDIGSNCCEGCNYLQTVNIGSGLQRMGDYAFYGCNRMNSFNCTSFQIQEFGYGSLWNNSWADSFNSSNTTALFIGNMLYRYYRAADTQMFAADLLGHNVTYIYDYAFSAAAYQYGDSVRFFYMPDVEHIGVNAFINCPYAWLLISRAKMQASYGANYESIIESRVHPTATIQWLA